MKSGWTVFRLQKSAPKVSSKSQLQGLVLKVGSKSQRPYANLFFLDRSDFVDESDFVDGPDFVNGPDFLDESDFF